MEKNINYNVPTLLEALQQALEPVKHDYSIIKQAIDTKSATPELVNSLIERITSYEPATEGSPLHSISKVGGTYKHPYCDAVHLSCRSLQSYREEYRRGCPEGLDDYAVLDCLEEMLFNIESSIFSVQRIDNINCLRSNLMSLDLDFRELMEKVESVIVPVKNFDNAKRIQYTLNLLADVSDVISTCLEQE